LTRHDAPAHLVRDVPRRGIRSVIASAPLRAGLAGIFCLIGVVKLVVVVEFLKLVPVVTLLSE
jgi:hypothetical protein